MCFFANSQNIKVFLDFPQLVQLIGKSFLKLFVYLSSVSSIYMFFLLYLRDIFFVIGFNERTRFSLIQLISRGKASLQIMNVCNKESYSLSRMGINLN